MSSADPASAGHPVTHNGTPPREAGHRDRLFRVIILMAVLGSVAIVWWSFGLVLSPRQQQSRELSLQVARLSGEVDNLDRQWTPAQIAALTNRFRQVGLTLFEGRAGVEAWLANLKEIAASLALDAGATFGQTNQQTAGGRTLTVIPTTVSVEVKPAGPESKTPSPYQRILQLGELLSYEKKRADLTELRVDGGPNSMSRVVMVLDHWTGKEAAP